MNNIHALPTHRHARSRDAAGTAVLSLPPRCADCTARELSICGPLTAEEQASLAALTTHVALEARQPICHEGDDAAHVYNITAGSIAVSKSLADGRRQITAFLGPGDFLGFNASNSYSFSAETLTDTKLCRFPRRQFKALLEQTPHLAHRLLAVAEGDLDTQQEQLLLLGRKTAMERIASFLLLRIDRAKRRGLPVDPLFLPMTRAEVGDYLGLTIETVSRCFTKLRKLGVIQLVSADRVQIARLAELRTLATAGAE